MGQTVLQWHPGFAAALEIEFEEEKQYLQFFREVNLTKKPLQMDVLIIKLITERKIKKPIGQIFKKHNIVEYKSPEDYISINDFYKVMAYACLYQADTERVLEIDPRELTLTFVESRYPKKLINHLNTCYKVEMQHPFPGIYYVNGLMFPTQIVVNTELSKEENVWLSRLGHNLKAKEDIEPLARAYKGKENNPLYAAVMNLIVQANEKEYEEDKGMCEALRALFADELEEKERNGIAVGLAQGLTQGIRVVVGMYQEMGSSEEKAAAGVGMKFDLPPEEAERYVKQYWEEKEPADA